MPLVDPRDGYERSGVEEVGHVIPKIDTRITEHLLALRGEIDVAFGRELDPHSRRPLRLLHVIAPCRTGRSRTGSCVAVPPTYGRRPARGRSSPSRPGVLRGCIVYSSCGEFSTFAAGPCSTIRPARITATSSA